MPALNPPPWLVEILQSVNLWDAVLFVAGVIAAGVGSWAFARKAWPALRAFARAVLALSQVIESLRGLPAFIARTDATLAAQDARIGEIHHELHPNSGTSMNDALRRVEEGVAGLYTAVDDLAAVDDRLWLELENTHPTEGGNNRD
ncbi:hypothetical protein [Microbacterium sp. Bi128]|uniref:hypothetical protein n=1 Tax=Microbacterium sp. Bi128 TaxID=2821115 RepID=UPI001DEC9F2D|nr:hypothetical protein [Microbacterium sp. Bi128]CAH0258015.1 hypothetical protein SRABI128_03073 [Microbacterium sp. Bi128]